MEAKPFITPVNLSSGSRKTDKQSLVPASAQTRSQAVIYLPSCPHRLHYRNPAPKIKLPGGITPCMGHGLGSVAVGSEFLESGEAALGSEGATEHQ